MPRRHIQTERQRKTLLDIPTDEASLLRHYILADDDLEYIQTRSIRPVVPITSSHLNRGIVNIIKTVKMSNQTRLINIA